MSVRPLTTPFTQNVESWGHYSHFTLSATLHGAYPIATHVPSIQSHARCAALSLGSSEPPLLLETPVMRWPPCLHEFSGPPLGSYSRCPVRNNEIRRFICDSLYAEVDRAWRR
jgi:hypothetical protein